MRRARTGLVLGLLFGGHAAFGAEPSPRVTLALTRGDGTGSCLDAATLERAVERRLRRPVFVRAGDQGLRIDVALGHDAAGVWSAQVALRAEGGAELGARALETRAKHCSALDDAVVLVVALLADSPEAREPPTPATSEAPGAAAESHPRGAGLPVAPPQPATSLEIPADGFAPREPFRVELGAALAAELGSLPALSPGGELMLGVRPPHFIELRLKGVLLSAEEAHAPTPDRGGRFALALVGFEACFLEHESGRLRVAGCLDQRVGRLAAQGFGFRQQARATELYYSLGAGLTGTYWLAPPVGVELGLEGAAPLTPNAYFSLGPAGQRREIFRPSVLAGSAALGLVFALR